MVQMYYHSNLYLTQLNTAITIYLATFFEIN